MERVGMKGERDRDERNKPNTLKPNAPKEHTSKKRPRMAKVKITKAIIQRHRKTMYDLSLPLSPLYNNNNANINIICRDDFYSKNPETLALFQ
jgi:hypothetical protein